MKYLLTKEQTNVFAEHASVVIELEAVLGAGVIIALVSGIWFDIMWVIAFGVCALILFAIVLAWLCIVGYQSARRKRDDPAWMEYRKDVD